MSIGFGSRYLKTVNYRGVELFVDSIDWVHGQGYYLIPLIGPPELCMVGVGVYMHKIRYFGYNLNLIPKKAGYAIQIEDKWYMPYNGNFCHINILLAKLSKLGRAL